MSGYPAPGTPERAAYDEGFAVGRPVWHVTRDELVADLARHLRHDVEVYDEADAARAVLDRLEALGWRHVPVEPHPRDYRAEWESAARDALQWRDLAENAREDAEHLRGDLEHMRRELRARGLARVAEAPLPLGGPGQGTEVPR